MEDRKRKALEAAGYRLGDAADFLGMTDPERRMLDLRDTLSEAVRRLRLEQGLTQKELAERLGTGQARIARMELGLPGVALDALFRALFDLGGGFADLGEARPDPAGRVAAKGVSSTSRRRPGRSLAK